MEKNIKIVIQCAGRKTPANSLCLNKKPISFVARPSENNEHAPWDKTPYDNFETWIDYIRHYNDINVNNPENLAQAGCLYSHPTYTTLINRFGANNVSILSAGWGLVRATDYIPTYNITFSTAQNVPRNSRITPTHRAQHLSVRNAVTEKAEVHLFLTPKYLAYWSEVNFAQDNTCILHWRAGQSMPANWQGDVVNHDCGNARTNWHYIAAQQFIN